MDFALKRMILNSNCVATYGNGMNRYVAGFIEDNTGTCYCHAVFGNTFDEAFCYVQQFYIFVHIADIVKIFVR